MSEVKDGSGGLRRELGLWGASSIVVGTVIGSGIFLVPTAMINHVGTPAMVFVVWIVGGLLSLAGALTYAELSAAMPEAGGEYVYLREAYGPFWGFVYGWTQMWVAKSGSVATLATAFFYYLANFRPSLEGVLWVVPLPIGPGGAPLEIRYGQLLGIVVILLLGLVNYFGVKVGAGLQISVTVVKVALILATISVGLLAPLPVLRTGAGTVAATGGLAGFFAALVAALWAYDVWNNLTMVSGEVRNPQRNLPPSLVLGTAVVVVLYLATNLAYFRVLSAGEVASTNRVAATMMARILGAPGAAAVSIAAMISIFAALNGSILSGARVPYAMARDGLFFAAAGRVHPAYHSPSISILLMSVWSALLVLSGRYEQLFTYVIFANWILYAMSTASVIVLRRKRPEMPRPYRTVGYPVLPILFVLCAMGLVLSTLIKSPRESLLGLALIVAGIPFYLSWKRRKST
jgi:APA family basic amino acid/polyamine antiporter